MKRTIWGGIFCLVYGIASTSFSQSTQDEKSGSSHKQYCIQSKRELKSSFLSPKKLPLYHLKSKRLALFAQGKRTFLKLAQEDPESFKEHIDYTFLEELYFSGNPYVMKAVVDLLTGSPSPVQEHLHALFCLDKVRDVILDDKKSKQKRNLDLGLGTLYTGVSGLGLSMAILVPSVLSGGILLAVVGAIGGIPLLWFGGHKAAFYRQHKRLCAYLKQ